MGKYRGYEKYKDSGVKWLGAIPEHWEVKSLRYSCEFLNKRRIPLSSEHRGTMLQKIYPYYGASGIIDYVEDFIFNEPTILIAEDGANLLSRTTPLAFIAEGEYWVNNHAHILKPFLGVFGFWANLLCIIEYDFWITGSAQPKLTKDNLASIKLPVPSLDEQQTIAQFLDHKTKQIDELIAKKEALLEKLDEKRTALISHAVTKGLDPNVPMKDSGIEWLGQIPEHWKSIRIKFIGNIKYGLGEPPEKMDDGLPIIRATDIYRGIIDGSKVQRVNPDKVPWSRNPELKAGDILVVRSGAYTGDSAIVLNEWAGAIAGYDMVLTPTKAYSKYIALNLLSKHILEGQIYLAKSRAAQPHLNAEELGNTIIGLPPFEEQKLISQYLDQKTAEIEQQKAKIQQAIELLKEYRTALITNAVTGKIDVRQVPIP